MATGPGGRVICDLGGSTGPRNMTDAGSIMAEVDGVWRQLLNPPAGWFKIAAFMPPKGCPMPTPMPAGRLVKLHKDGRGQSVRLPRGFELPGEYVVIRRIGQRLVIEAAPARAGTAAMSPIEGEA